MNSATALRIAAVFGFLAVALGAFGAHNLKVMLEANGTMEIWKTAALYHLAHAVALLIVAQRTLVPRITVWLFAAGIVVFSGTLYVLAITNIKWLGAITPLGGLSLMAGWLSLWRAR
jgi:uncharacterized membrane protein YgdD (TMEM256/DUF423 family)